MPFDTYIKSVRGISLGLVYLRNIEVHLPKEYHSGLQGIIHELEVAQEKLMAPEIIEGARDAE
jgi:hypothetical protein